MNAQVQMQQGQESKARKEGNAMREVYIEKVVVSCGGLGEDLEKSKKLLEILTNRKVNVVHAGPKQRIPDFGVRPGVALGVQVTLRNSDAIEMLRRLLGAIGNKLSRKQINDNTFSFGIKEYIEIPGVEYNREIGIRGLNVSVSFARKGLRVKLRHVKRNKLSHKQAVSAEEIVKFMKDKFGTTIK
ncbi:50S ribosomal protein L5 [Candidatus Pacearchaeota archaeon]|nr:MAG: 50S ribosomal protein L5 [Candidatus Pacearchaeota archaeon]